MLKSRSVGDYNYARLPASNEFEPVPCLNPGLYLFALG